MVELEVGAIAFGGSDGRGIHKVIGTQMQRHVVEHLIEARLVGALHAVGHSLGVVGIVGIVGAVVEQAPSAAGEGGGVCAGAILDGEQHLRGRRLLALLQCRPYAHLVAACPEEFTISIDIGAQLDSRIVIAFEIVNAHRGIANIGILLARLIDIVVVAAACREQCGRKQQEQRSKHPYSHSIILHNFRAFHISGLYGVSYSGCKFPWGLRSCGPEGRRRVDHWPLTIDHYPLFSVHYYLIP